MAAVSRERTANQQISTRELSARRAAEREQRAGVRVSVVTPIDLGREDACSELLAESLAIGERAQRVDQIAEQLRADWARDLHRPQGELVAAEPTDAAPNELARDAAALTALAPERDVVNRQREVQQLGDVLDIGIDARRAGRASRQCYENRSHAWDRLRSHREQLIGVGNPPSKQIAQRTIARQVAADEIAHRLKVEPMRDELAEPSKL